jgi:opacity protein-like surface antigen
MSVSRVVFAFAIALVVSGAAPAAAQDASWGDLKVSLARIDYDLSGTGSAAGLTVRTTRDLSPSVRLEVGGVFARPEQQLVGTSTLFLPEAQLQYRWNIGRLAPYVGGGLGAALVKSPLVTDWDPTLSAAAGTDVRITDRLAVTGEFRLRGHEWRATGTTAEFSAGLSWRLPSF